MTLPYWSVGLAGAWDAPCFPGPRGPHQAIATLTQYWPSLTSSNVTHHAFRAQGGLGVTTCA